MDRVKEFAQATTTGNKDFIAGFNHAMKLVIAFIEGKEFRSCANCHDEYRCELNERVLIQLGLEYYSDIPLGIKIALGNHCPYYRKHPMEG